MADTGHKAIQQTITCFSEVVYFLLKACKKLARRGNMAVLAFLFAYLPGATPAMAQKVYPVEANLQITPPFSLYLGDYTTGDERLKVNLFLKDLTKSNYPVRLKLKIEGFGITIVSKNNFYTPPIYLNGGQLHVVSGPELQDYFNPQNLAFQGIDLKAFNRNGAKLPEGVYRISIEVEDYSRRQLVSNAGAAVLSAFMSYPPVINQPFPDAKVTALFPQHLVFQWMPRHTASFNAAFNIVYRLRLVEVNPAGRDPNDAMRSSRPLFETITHLTQYVYGPSEPQLVPGNTYALQVQALDADGKDAFVNQGYSEVVRFVYGEKCAVPISVLAQLQDKNSLQLSWAQLPMQQRYSVRYREANNSKAEWFEQEVYTTQFNARGLRPGTTYEYQVKAACDYGYGDYTVAQQFTMPNEAVTTGDIVCGELSSVKAPTNKELLPLLQPGMVFFAGSFPVHVTEVQGGGERFTGRGTIGVPYLNKLNFAVEFKDIQINTDLKLINGRVSIAKQSLEQSQEGVKQAITVTPDENGVVEAIASNGLPTIIDVAVAVPATLPTYNAKDKTVTFTGLTNNGTSKEITIKLKDGQPPLLFQDKNGETYEVAQDGKVTHKGKFSTAEMLAGGSLTNKLLSTDKATVAFMAAPGQKYGLDIFQQSLASNSRYKEAYQQVPTSQGSTYVSWKSVEAGAGDVVVAEITNASVDLDKIEFRTGKGDKLTSKRDGKQFTISLVGAPEGNDREIYAFYPTDKDGKEGLNLGKLNIASFKKITKKVVIVPVNGAGGHLTAAAIRSHLNSIYQQAVVDWEVTTADNFVAYTDGEDGWDLDRNGLDVGNSSMASAYTAEQKKLAGLYAKKNTLQDKTYYLFLVNRFSDPGQKGYMVRGGQVGFVKVSSHDAETDAAVLHTIAHELGHGAFKLEHTWEVYGKDTQGDTTNLMNYGNGTELWYGQWKYMRNQDVIFRPFQGDQDGSLNEIEKQFVKFLFKIRNSNKNKTAYTLNQYDPVAKQRQRIFVAGQIFSTIGLKYYSQNGVKNGLSVNAQNIKIIKASTENYISIDDKIHFVLPNDVHSVQYTQILYDFLTNANSVASTIGGEFPDYETYKLALGDVAKPLKEWYGQDGCWLTKDRQDRNQRWNKANRYNIENKLLGRYGPFIQVADFYDWVDKEAQAKGHNIKWMKGAKRLVYALANDLNTGHWAVSNDVESMLSELNIQICDYAIGKFHSLLYGDKKNAKLTGATAYQFDLEFVKYEQMTIALPVYEKYKGTITMSRFRDMANRDLYGTHGFGAWWYDDKAVIPAFDELNADVEDPEVRVDIPMFMLYLEFHKAISRKFKESGMLNADGTLKPEYKKKFQKYVVE